MEIKYPITFRPSVLIYIGSFIMTVFVIPPLLFLAFGLIHSKVSMPMLLIIVFPLSFIPAILMILTLKLEVNEDGFEIFGMFLTKPKQFIRWADITKVTANTNFSPTLFFYYQNMKPYTPLRVPCVFFSKKTVGKYLEILVSKSPNAEMGLGMAEFRKKFV